MKHSIKERAKKVPLRIKLMVNLRMFWIDLKYKFEAQSINQASEDYYNRDKTLERK